MKSWIKAGLIGAAITIFFTLLTRALYFLPIKISTILYPITCVPFLIIYPATGVLSAHWLPTPKTILQGGITGILAGLIIGILDTTVSIFLDVILLATGASGQYFQFQQFQNNEPSFAIYIGTFVCWGLIWLSLGVFLSGLGGLTYVAIKKSREHSE